MKIAQKVFLSFSFLGLSLFLIQSLRNPLKVHAVRKIVTTGLEDDGTHIRQICDMDESTGETSNCSEEIESIPDTYLGIGLCAYITDSGEKKVRGFATQDNGHTTINNCTINESTGAGTSCTDTTTTIDDTIKDFGHFCYMNSAGDKKLVGVNLHDNGDFIRYVCDLNEEEGMHDNCVQFAANSLDTSIIGWGGATFINSSGQRKVIGIALEDNGNWERQICDLNETTGGSSNCTVTGTGTVSDTTVSNAYYIIPTEEEWGIDNNNDDDNDDNNDDNNNDTNNLPQTAKTSIFLPSIISFSLAGIILISKLILPGKSNLFSAIFFKKD